MSLTRLAQRIIQQHSKENPIYLAIDATCGNGNDTVFLAKISHLVFGFDIQDIAIQKTTERLQLEGLRNNVQLFQLGHENIEHVLLEQPSKHTISVATFNFGYLPKGNNPEITTQPESSIQAITSVLKYLEQKGIVSLLCYRGHTGGAEEYRYIKAYLNSLDTTIWQIDIHHSHNATDNTPVLFIIYKL